MAAPVKFSRRQFARVALGGLALPASVLYSEQTQSPDIERVSERMLQTDTWRAKTLLGYSGMRRYTLAYGDSGTTGKMLAKVDYSYPGHKRFQVISKENCGFLQDEVFHRAMDAEIQAARDDTRDSTRIIPVNYDFEVLGTEDLAGRSAYVISIRPKHRRRFLVDGKIWVDRKDAAVVRIDGEVNTGSFWVRSAHMVQTYKRVGPYWLVASNRSDATVRFVGHARLDIEYFDYHLRPA